MKTDTNCIGLHANAGVNLHYKFSNTFLKDCITYLIDYRLFGYVNALTGFQKYPLC